MKKQFAAITLAVLSAVPASAFACSFNYSIYAAESISKRISAQIGKYVTNEYCQKYNKEYQIVIIAQGYMTETLSVGHSIVGLRKRGSNVYPANARNELLHPMRCKGWSFTGRVNPRLDQFLAGY